MTMHKKSSPPFHKGTFEKIPDEKKQRIFSVASAEFSSQGYASASINTIAKKAGISIGSMYSYFKSKEDLFLAIADSGYEILNHALADLDPDKGSIFEVIERLLDITIRYAEEHVEMCKLYLDLSTDQLASLSVRLSERMELRFETVYKRILKKACELGEIRPDTDLNVAAFYLDNIVVMLQHSYSSAYYKLRLEHYLGMSADAGKERIRNGLLALIKRSLQ